MFVRNSSRIRLGLKCPFLIRLFHGKRGFTMDFLTGNIKTIYFKYLSAAFGSTLISCMDAVELQKNTEEQERQAENRNLLRWCRIYSAKLINAKRNGVTEVTPYSPRKSGLLIFFCFTGTARKPGGFKHCLTLIPQLFPARQSPSYTLRLPMLKLDSGNRPEPEPYTVPSLL